MQKRRSLPSTVRLSLLAGAGALGWMALGASGASAAQDPAGVGLVESTSSVVVATIAPTESQLSGITAPLATAATSVAPSPSAVPSVLAGVPAVPDLAVQVPQLLSQPAATVLSPVTAAVDHLAAQVPIVQQHVPAGTVTEVIAPVVEAVDGVIGGVAQPVLGSVPPVTEVVEIAPITDVVVPAVVGSVADAVAVPEAPQPAVEPATRIVVSTPDSAVLPAQDDVRLSGAVIATDFANARAAADDSATGAGTFGVPTSLVLSSLEDANLPVLTHLVASSDAAPAPLHGALAAFAGVAASMTGGGSSAPIAAIGASALLVFVLFVDRGRRAATAGLPTSPSFDPGSSPD